MTNLSGKTALVTGASRGIGRATALALAAAGACVLVHYGRGAKEADSVVAEIRKSGGRAEAVVTDLAAPDGAHKLAEQVRRIVGERLDILVANAGVDQISDHRRHHGGGLRQPVRSQCPRAVLSGAAIAADHGRGQQHRAASRRSRRTRSSAPLPAYAATKGAIDTLVKHFASVLGARGIRVNAVAPGVVATDMSNFTKTDAGRDYVLGLQALKRFAQPDDIAGAVAFLASNDARWITGDTIQVDGGSKL